MHTHGTYHDQRRHPRKDEELKGEQATNVATTVLHVIRVIKRQILDILRNGCHTVGRSKDTQTATCLRT